MQRALKAPCSVAFTSRPEGSPAGGHGWAAKLPEKRGAERSAWGEVLRHPIIGNPKSGVHRMKVHDMRRTLGFWD